MPPLFSLERLQPGKYCFKELNKEGRAAFAESVFARKDLTWRQIKSIDRHALGTEKIKIKSIKAPLPAFLADDADHVLAFRYKGKNPMVGIRVRNVFYVIWFDHDFSLYKH